jgi:DNA-binding CsgD family transcriptional regulator
MSGRKSAIYDEELFTRDELKHSAMHNELLAPHRLGSFGAVAVWAGPQLWALSLQRGVSEGPFEQRERDLIERLSPALSNAATLSAYVGRAALGASLHTLQMISEPAASVGRSGIVLAANEGAHELFRTEPDVTLRGNRLFVRDEQAAKDIEYQIGILSASDCDTTRLPPVAARTSTSRPVMISTIPVPIAAANSFMGARAILIFRRPDPNRHLSRSTVARLFGLTVAEARIAQGIYAGLGLEEIAERQNVSVATVRNQLKSIFSKTDTHRQAQLVALLSSLVR